MIVLWLAVATAGVVRFETKVPVEVREGALPVIQTYGESQIDVPSVAAGAHTYTILRSSGSATIAVEVPEKGTVLVRITDADVSTNAAPAVVSESAAPPKVVIEAKAGQAFAVVLDGERIGAVTHDAPMTLDGLTLGAHTLQLRSPDHLTVWAKGDLQLIAGDIVTLRVAEGYPVEVFGRSDAWR